MSESKPKTVTVSVELPEPPEGWEWESVPRIPKNDDWYLSASGSLSQNLSHLLRNDICICCRRVHKFPANAVGTFYPRHANNWFFTDSQIADHYQQQSSPTSHHRQSVVRTESIAVLW